MSWKNVSLIFTREVRDQLRDRRTLFMILILPLLLYPSLGIGTVQMAVLFTEQARTVVILGRDNLPEQPQLLEGDRFVKNWFRLPGEAAKLKVITDSQAEQSDSDDGESERQKQRREQLLSRARNLREKIEQKDRLEAQILRAQRTGDRSQRLEAEESLRALKAQLTRLFAGRMQVLIIIPEGFARNIAAVNQTGLGGSDTAISGNEIADAHTAESLGDITTEGHPSRPRIVHNVADEKSMIAYRRVKEALDSWEHEILKRRLEVAGLDESWAEPVNPDPVDLAADEQLSANLWSKLFPALLVIMTVTGAFYPAVDLAAGEKERGTMETLLICPAKRSEIVVGKFFTVMLFSCSTAALNLASIGLTGKYLASIAGSGSFGNLGDLALPSWMAIAWAFILMVPLAALFSALCLALATFARSSKEGQYYLTPLLMTTLGLTVFCLSPAVEIKPFYSVMPVAGPALLMKELIVTPTRGEALIYAIPVLITSIGYSLLALWWAIEQFNREDVLFRESEQFEFGLWVRHLMRDKEPTPSFTEAGFCFVLIMFLQFAALKFMQGSMQNATPGTVGQTMLKLLLIQQIALIASPALFMGVMLTKSLGRTFRLRIPNLRMLAVAAALPFALHPLSLELSATLQRWFFLPLPESFTQQLRVMSDGGQPLWLILLAFAAAPAICEELAFRGFILSGFRRSRRVWLAIGLSSLTFGIMHIIPQQVFNASLLGLVLGLIAIRSNSLLPCVVFHFLFNSLEIVRQRVGTAVVEQAPVWDWFVFQQDGAIRYYWPTLIISAAVAFVLLRWLVNQNDANEQPANEPEPPRAVNLDAAPIAEEPPVQVG